MLPGRSASRRRGRTSNSSPDARRASSRPTRPAPGPGPPGSPRCRRARRSAPIWNCSQPRRAPSCAPPGRSCASVVVVEAGDAGHHALQRGRLRHRGAPLGLGVVRAPEHPDADRPSPGARPPMHRVVAVVELLLARGELAVGGVAAADVLHDDDVAVRGQPDRVGVHQVDVDVLVVRLPRQQDRVRRRVGGPVDVGAQHDPVPHPTLDVVLDKDVTPRHHRAGHETRAYGASASDKSSFRSVDRSFHRRPCDDPSLSRPGQPGHVDH